MIRVCVLAELLAIIALIAGIPVTVACTVAIIAATPATAVAIYRILKNDKSGAGFVDVDIVVLFLTWTMLPCLLLLHATAGVDENVFRFVVAARTFAAASIWRHTSEWHKRSNGSVDGGDNREEGEDLESLDRCFAVASVIVEAAWGNTN